MKLIVVQHRNNERKREMWRQYASMLRTRHYIVPYSGMTFINGMIAPEIQTMKHILK